MIAVFKKKIVTKEFWVQIISLLFIILFTYAAISKLLKYEDFNLQLSQSPFLSAFADALSWGIPAVELIIAALFFFPKLNLEGFWSSFILMLIFTTYLITVLNFSDDIPCSCGGIISSLSWNQHLYFNIGFIVLAGCGILLVHPRKKNLSKAKGSQLNKKL